MNPGIRQSFPRRQDGARSRIENAILSSSTEIAMPAVLPTGRAEAVKRKVRIRVAMDDRYLQTAMSNALGGRSDIEVSARGSPTFSVPKRSPSRGPMCWC